ncbi:murein transglycosylase [Shigella flexneri]|nr:murein transglycosylase [Shigella flexneri]
MILNKNKPLKPVFCANLRQGEAAHFIKRGGLLSSLRLIF